MQGIKVLMLVPGLNVANGVTSFVMNYYRKIYKEEIYIDFALYSDVVSPFYEEIKAKGGRIIILPPVRRIKKHLAVCRKVLIDGNYDVIHDNTVHLSIPMMWCAKMCRVPVRILHSHNSKMGETLKKEMRNKLFLPVLRGMATDYAACSKLAGMAMFGKRDFVLIPNVVNVDVYYYDEKKRKRVRRQMDADGKYIFGTVARLSEQKNPFFAVCVFLHLLREMPNAEYWWIGSGALDNRVREYVNVQGLSEKVRFLGSRKDVFDLYQAMDCFFLPSFFEGLPVTGVEAQAVGLPMVVSDAVTDEMIFTDLVDYVSLKESPTVWAKHLSDAVERKVDRKSYSKKLKQSIFSDVGCGERLADIYKEMIQKHGRRKK